MSRLQNAPKRKKAREDIHKIHVIDKEKNRISLKYSSQGHSFLNIKKIIGVRINIWNIES